MERFNLTKTSAAARFALVKQNVEKVTCNVALLIDVSGSMADEFADGTVQNTIDRVFALAFNLDPDKVLEVFAFGRSVKQIPSMKENDCGNYVKNVFLRHVNVGGGTDYAPAINGVTDFYKNPSTQPILVLFITDGQNGDESLAKSAFGRTENGNVYFQCVGIGPNRSEFRFLERMANDFDHVGFMHMPSLKISDEKLYEELVNTEFTEFLKKF